jgi:hypothetical protein
MMLADGAVDTRLIVGAITGEGGKWIGDLVKQRLDLNVSSGSEYQTFLKDKGTTVPDPLQTLNGNYCCPLAL